MSPDPRTKAREQLIAWFRTAGRDLPWRRRSDPYAIWLSEVMLQQTRVDTVLAYFERFLHRFPTVRDLAQASETEVLAMWSGLGYYRRGRLLHQGAQRIVEAHGGEVPRAREDRLALPGVGAYTAGAVGSIAFGLPEPIVDGNVARVLSRVHGIEAALGTRASDDALWAAASDWIEGESKPGTFNQALMELGSLVCTKASPRCAECPLRTRCVAHAEGRQRELPRPKQRKEAIDVACVAVIASRGDDVLVQHAVKSPLGGSIFAGLYVPPMRAGEGRVAAEALAKAKGVRLEVGAPRTAVHVLSHRRLCFEVYRATPCARRRARVGEAWARVGDPSIPMPALVERLVDAAMAR